MKDVILLSLVLIVTVVVCKFGTTIKETYLNGVNDLKSIQDSGAWRDTLRNGKQEFTKMLSTMPADIAMLTYISQHPDLRVNIEAEVFPEDSVTRSTFLDASQLQMTYDERLKTLHNAKFAFLNDVHEQDVLEALERDSVCRGAFAKILMNNALFGCLLNNLKIGGDLDYCFFDYFSKNPDDFRALTDAFHQLQSRLTPFSPLSNPNKSPNELSTSPAADTTPVPTTTKNTVPPSSASNQKQENQTAHHSLPSRVTQMCLTSYDPFPRSGRAIDEIASAKQVVDKLKRESAIKTLDIRKLQKALLDNQEELSSIRRACGYIYMPTSEWLSRGSGDCATSLGRLNDKPVVPYQSLAFSEVPKQ